MELIEMDKKRLIANNLYIIIICCVLDFFMLGFVVVATVVNHLLGMIVIYSVFLSVTVASIICIQTATLTKEGFVIKCCGFRIVQANWDQIVKIEVLDLNTLRAANGTRDYTLKWIVLYTEEGQKAKGGGPTWKKAPWMIIATKKNQNAVREFAPKEIISF